MHRKLMIKKKRTDNSQAIASINLFIFIIDEEMNSFHPAR
jgi:hypothetical protein